MQKSVKRFLSLLLVCMLILSALPVHGLAAHAEEVEEVPASEMPTETPAEPIEEPAEDPVAETPAAEDPAEEIPAKDPVEESTVEVPAEPAEEVDAEIPAETVYTITFQDWDGAVLATVPAAEGETPVYPNEAPQRAADETYVYMFAGWDVDGDNVITEADVIPAATEDATYVAVYDCSENPEAVVTTALSDSNIGFAVEVEGDRETDNALPDGDTIVITASGIADYGIVEIANKTTVTLTNNYPTAMNLSFDFKWEMDNGGIVEIDGVVTAPGTSVSVPLDPGDFLEIVVTGGDGTTKVTISNLKLSAQKTDVETTFAVPVNGSYTVDGNAITAAYVGSKSATESYAVAATAAEGYVFFGWYNETTEKTISYEAVTTLTITDNATVCPVFVEANKAIFGVGTDKFHDLQKAGEFAKTNGISQIILLNNGTLTGEHTIPAGVTLLIPYDELNTAHGANASCTSTNGNNLEWETPTAYRTLTMAAGAKIVANGNIEVGGQHAAAGGGGGKRISSPTGPLGYIKMETGSNITMKAGTNLYAWGYVYGNGTVTVESGAAAHEIFQIMDFRGGNATVSLAGDGLVFPLSQYYVQNVEVEMTFHGNAKEYLVTSIYAQEQCVTTADKGVGLEFIGANGMFRPGANSRITKTYDPDKDELRLDTYGDCSLAPMTVTLANNAINSGMFVLPITNNIQIAIHSGTATLKQNMMMLPGSSLTIDDGAILNLSADEKGAFSLYVFDDINWTQGIHMGVMDEKGGFTGTFATHKNLTFVHPAAQFIPVPYTASTGVNVAGRRVKDVVVDVNGKIITEGFLYSTVEANIEFNIDPETEEVSPAIVRTGKGGAEIKSSAKTGIVVMQNGAGLFPWNYQYDQSNASYYAIPIASAQLKNGDGSMLDTTGAEAGTTFKYCAKCDEWHNGDCTVEWVKVTWMNGEEELYNEEIVKGTVPTYKSENPEKAYDEESHYYFAGWSTTVGGSKVDNLPAVTEDTTFYAVYTAEEHAYENGACECGAKEPVTALLGDIDLDGDVDTYDLTALARHVGGIEVLTKAQALANADVDGSGEIDTYDLTKHARYVGGIITDWKQN